MDFEKLSEEEKERFRKIAGRIFENLSKLNLDVAPHKEGVERDPEKRHQAAEQRFHRILETIQGWTEEIKHPKEFAQVTRIITWSELARRIWGKCETELYP